MKRARIEIELLSDLCVADGGVYNSYVDTDICYDSYGLPYIPAKRIKGCLRECAQELKDWGREISPEKLFGEGGRKENAGIVRIENARLEGYPEYLEEIKGNRGLIYHSQNVLNSFTSMRTQTAIDEETGSAKKNSLRTIRVINKGLRFQAEVLLEEDGQLENLKDCCKALRNMGLARTRGLGEVKVSCTELAKKEPLAEKVAGDAAAYAGECCLEYAITLCEPMICKSINGGESNSLDYIEGSKIIGLLAKSVGNSEKLRELLREDSLVFSNAYLTKGGMRLTEVPAYVQMVKNEKKKYVNTLVYDEKEFQEKQIQINGMKHCYVNIDQQEILHKASVEMEERYHHSRPWDKSIGRAVDTDESKFYQISSIQEDQIFSGFICGKAESIKAVYDYLKDLDICYLGYGRASEYGKCRWKLTPSKDSGREKQVTGREFIVTLNAPAIVYNTAAMYSTDKQDLLEEILVNAGLKASDAAKLDMEATKFYLKYTSLGGYNVTWQERKPVISAFDKGTAVKLVFTQEVTVKTGDKIFLGERNQEGYGECSIRPLTATNQPDKWLVVTEEEEKISCVGKKDALGHIICRMLFADQVKLTAGKLVLADDEKGAARLGQEKSRATISNLMLMCDEMQTWKEIDAAVVDRFSKNSDTKRDKKEIAVRIQKLVTENTPQMIEEFCAKYNIREEMLGLSEDEARIRLLRELLIAWKYRIRGKEGSKNV